MQPATTTALSAITTSLSLLIACTSDSTDAQVGGNADEGAGEIAVAELPNALGEAYCGRFFGPDACCSDLERNSIFVPNLLDGDEVPTDVPSCAAYYRDRDVVADHIAAGVSDGRLVYDPKAAAACVEQIASSCEFTARVTNQRDAALFWLAPALPEFCKGVVTPTGEGGCFEDLDCQAGTYCRPVPGECKDGPDGVTECSTGSFPGTCEAPLALGESCLGDGLQCASALACPATPTDDDQLLCIVKKQLGDECNTFFDECASGNCVGAVPFALNGTCAEALPFCQRMVL